MDPLALNQLLAVLDEQAKIVADLATLGQKKAQALVSGSLDELDILLRGEQALVWQLGKLEEQRFTHQSAVAMQMGIHPGQLTLERLLSAVPGEYTDRCQSLAQRYSRSARTLTKVNHLNTELIQQAMAYVDFSLQLLGGRGPATGQVYSARGERGLHGGPLRRLDNRV